MKVLKKGVVKNRKHRDPYSWIGRKVKCGGCNCVFKLEDRDLVSAVRVSSVCDDLDHHEVACPQCGRKLKFNVDYRGKKTLIGFFV